MKNKRILIWASTWFLGFASVIMMINELVFYFLDAGPLKEVLSTMPGATLGFFEAHGLAFLLVLFLLREYRVKWRRDLHLYFGTIHLFLGFSNVIFWFDLFDRFEMVPLGLLVTTLHFILMSLQFFIFFREKLFDTSER